MLVGISAGRWWHGDQMPIKLDIGPSVSRRIMLTAGRCRFAELMPIKSDISQTMSRRACRELADSGLAFKCRSNPTSAQACRELADSGLATKCRWNPTSARQQADDTYPSGPWADVTVPTSGRCCVNIWPMHLYWHPTNVVLASSQCRLNVLQWGADFMIEAGGYDNEMWSIKEDETFEELKLKPCISAIQQDLFAHIFFT